jgi:hypothetical protein
MQGKKPTFLKCWQNLMGMTTRGKKMGLFSKSKTEKEVDDLIAERDELRKTLRKLKDEVLEEQSKKKMEIEEIKHLNRLAQEKRDIELDREKLKVQREYADKTEKQELANRDALNERMKEYHAKIVQTLENHNKDMREVTTSVYKDIIARLPNVNVTMKR